MHQEPRPRAGQVGGQPRGSGSPHLDQVELGEEPPGHIVGRGAAPLGHAVDGHLHVAEQLLLQEEEQAWLFPESPAPLSPAHSGQRSVLGPGATFSACTEAPRLEGRVPPPLGNSGTLDRLTSQRVLLAGDTCAPHPGKGPGGDIREPRAPHPRQHQSPGLQAFRVVIGCGSSLASHLKEKDPERGSIDCGQSSAPQNSLVGCQQLTDPNSLRIPWSPRESHVC